MMSRKLFPLILLVLLVTLFVGVQLAAADTSHARIIRLSLVTGDVRFAAGTHGDPLSDSNAHWDTAPLNLPIRQGYVVATDNGRAEIEFENGTLAFLKENTVLQFYDLSLKDGALVTRLVLRQGSASFHVNPANDDYFSVTGGDFTVEANGRSTFRVDNFDDGSSVEDLTGRVNVLHKEESTPLFKGQSLSMKAGVDSVSVGKLPEQEDFDHWVSGQIDTVSTATAATMQYTSSPYYAAGFGSLYSYGSWFPCGGYGYGWRPFGAGFGWSPFTDGQWIMDPTFGWTWMSFQPWGWAPYHYGGWLFDAGCGGWFYSPPLLYGYGFFPASPTRRFFPRVHAPRPIFHPVTAVFVRNNNTLGIVPMHPLEKGKTPMNLEHGVLSPTDLGGRVLASTPGEKWRTLKSAPKDAFSSGLAPSGPPERVFRTVVASGSGARVVSMSKDSSIAYDAKDHRFVNSNNAISSARVSKKENVPASNRASSAADPNARQVPSAAPRASVPSARTVLPPRVTVPPPAPRSSGGWGGTTWGGSRSSGAASAGSAGRASAPAPAPAPAPHVSGGRPH
ncbi:MAG TPA: DUF6600 domain-containing protein [Candidatus Acidoferrum sp.]|nr:DUF6600 domain-containing protein [Candidatus Acidoferrum sp.]